jgi:hypothetical protein
MYFLGNETKWLYFPFVFRIPSFDSLKLSETPPPFLSFLSMEFRFLSRILYRNGID